MSIKLKEKYNKKMNNMIASGMGMVASSFSNIVLPEAYRTEATVESLKDDVLFFIKEHNGSTVSEIAMRFNIRIDIAAKIMMCLADEEKIKLQ